MIRIRLLGAVALTLFLLGCGQSPNSDQAAGGNAVVAGLKCIAQPVRGHSYSVSPAGSVSDFDMTIRTIMPPGNDGHFTSLALGCPGTTNGAVCNAPGNEPSDYGEHIDDQREMYWRSQYKDGAFMDVSAATPEHQFDTGQGQVTVYRDPYDVPVVHGDNGFSVWYGVGYAMAQDRLFLMDAALRQGTGRFAEFTGTGDVATDVQRRTLRYSRDEYQQFYNNLSSESRAALDGLAAGANKRIAEVRANATLLPMEYVALSITPQDVDPLDVLALGVFMTRFVAAAGGDEMENVRLYQGLLAQNDTATAKAIFKDLLWLNDTKATVTVPGQTFTNIATPPALQDAVLDAALDYAASIPLALADGPGTGAFPEPAPVQAKLPEDFEWPFDPSVLREVLATYQAKPKADHLSASYQVTANSAATEGDSTLILSAPQLGYSYPTLFYEIEVHGGGYHARGAGVPGLPVVGIGYGSRVAWALTTGESKTIDSFIVELTGDETYLFNGEERAMSCRDETVCTVVRPWVCQLGQRLIVRIFGYVAPTMVL